MNLGDNTYLDKPKFMTEEVAKQVIKKISEYCKRNGVISIRIIFHGGEPLLHKPDFYKFFVSELNSSIESNQFVKYGLQTNGVYINQQWIDVFKNLDIGVGVSIDGTESATNRYRVDLKGHSAFTKIKRGVDLISVEENKNIFGGLLSVIDIDNDPLETFNFLHSFNPPTIDFLLPDNNYNNPPKGKEINSKTEYYGVWLSKIFDYWFDNDLSNIKIRIFETIIHLLLGGKFSYEVLGLSPVEVLVIQTDGSYEAVDALKSTYNKATYTGKSAFDAEIEDLLDFPLIGKRLQKETQLCETCKKCDLVNVCGGGYIPHRWHSINKFDMPSIYCQDLIYIINHIKDKIFDSVEPELQNKINEILTPIEI